MKEIKAIIRPYRLDTVLEALSTHPGKPGATISHVTGFGRTVGRGRGGVEAPSQFGTADMVKIECVINDEDTEAVIDLIQQAAHTGKPGDGKIMVYDVPELVKIRSGARLTRIE